MADSDATSLAVEVQVPDGGWVLAGHLCRAVEATWFESLPEYWARVDRPVLGQLFEERGRDWRPKANVALPTWFSHLLPEGRLRDAIAADARVKPSREFHLLARVGGDDLPGAVRVAPSTYDQGALPLGEQLTAGTGAGTPAFKFSLAGVQLKFSVSERDRGLTVPITGQAGTWIAKLPDPRPGFESVTRAELAGLQLAKASGIDTVDASVIDVSSIERLPSWAVDRGGDALIVRRFDRRSGDQRVHVEELAQVLDIPTGENFKYERVNHETIARTVAALCGPERVADVIDRIVLNVLFGNGDAHAKNWAFVYPDGHTPVLSAAYDIVPTVLYVPGDDLGVNLNGTRAFEAVRLGGFARLADLAGWDGALGRARARDAVERVVAAWPVLDDHLDVVDVSRLTAHRDSLPLLGET